MENSEKFLQFNGKTILFLGKGGEYWVALKPICEALNIEYTRAFKNAKQDPIVGPRLAKMPMMVPDDFQPRKYLCLPEKYIYGWIFTLHSSNEELIEYKVKCYEVLYDFFHGTITQRKKLLNQVNESEAEIQRIREKLKDNPEFQRLNQLEGKTLRTAKELKQLDKKLLDTQLSFF